MTDIFKFKYIFRHWNFCHRQLQLESSCFSILPDNSYSSASKGARSEGKFSAILTKTEQLNNAR